MKYDGEGYGFSFYGGIHDGSGSSQELASIEDQHAIVLLLYTHLLKSISYCRASFAAVKQ